MRHPVAAWRSLDWRLRLAIVVILGLTAVIVLLQFELVPISEGQSYY